MADLHSILAKAVGTLNPNTKEARQRLYERARAALVAEARGLNQPEADFLEVLGALEDAIQKLEAEADAEAERERRIRNLAASTSGALPSDDDMEMPARPAAVSPRPAKVSPRPAKAPPRPAEKPPGPATPIAPQGLGQFFARALRRGRDGARSLLRPADRGEELPPDLANKMDFDQTSDNWLSEILERASREDENGDHMPLPRRDIRRNR